MTSIPSAEFEVMLRNSLSMVYSDSGAEFRNESDFKMELFHRLALEAIEGVPLVESAPGHRTCRLHAETKVENGNPAKADIVVCDPSRPQDFNYQVDYILELKHRLSRNDVEVELRKIRGYKRKYKGIFIISAQDTNVDLGLFADEITTIDQPIHIIQPASTTYPPKQDRVLAKCSLQEGYSLVQECLDATLQLYGNGREQFYGFFWCNYEHELNKKQTYPCEGDFVCQFYHRLKKTLGDRVVLRSEVQPKGSRNRIDIVVSAEDGGWCIPVDIKMNWDQFKHKYDQKTGARKTAEAILILERYRSLSAEYTAIMPITVVIQGSLAQQTDKRDRSMKHFSSCEFPHELVCYRESLGRVEKIQF